MMNLDNIDETLKELADSFFVAEKARKRISDIDPLLNRLYQDLELHRLKMRAEHQDVVKLEKMSKHLLIGRILGDQEAQLEKERQEYLQAVLEYNSIAEEINLLNFERDLLALKAEQFDELKRKRDYYLKVKEQKVLFNNMEHAERIKAMNFEVERMKVMQKEIVEAEKVCVEIKKEMKQAIQLLTKVDDFGNFELMTKFELSFTKKKSLNKAIANVNKINVLLNKLNDELGDIYQKYEMFSIYKYQNFVNSFHNHLITDWVLRNKLKTSVSSLETGQDQIQRILITLESDKKKAIQKHDLLVEEKRLYVLNS